MSSKKVSGSKGPAGSRRGRPPIETITDAQRRTLDAIRSYIDRRGFPPTIKELGEELGVSSASAHELVSQLIRKGYVRREAGKARSLEVIKARGRR